MLTPTVAAVTLPSVAAQNHNLSTDPKRVAQFSFGQTDTRECVPFLTNRENVT